MKNTAAASRARSKLAVRVFWSALVGGAWLLATALADHFAYPPQDATVTSLVSSDLSGVAGKELAIVTVNYPPGGSSPVRPDHIQAMTYVLNGSVVMQVKGEEPVTLRSGETFSEGPDDVSLVLRNASRTASAKTLVFLIKDRDAPIPSTAK